MPDRWVQSSVYVHQLEAGAWPGLLIDIFGIVERSGSGGLSSVAWIGLFAGSLQFKRAHPAVRSKLPPLTRIIEKEAELPKGGKRGIDTGLLRRAMVHNSLNTCVTAFPAEAQRFRYHPAGDTLVSIFAQDIEATDDHGSGDITILR